MTKSQPVHLISSFHLLSALLGQIFAQPAAKLQDSLLQGDVGATSF